MLTFQKIENAFSESEPDINSNFNNRLKSVMQVKKVPKLVYSAMIEIVTENQNSIINKWQEKLNIIIEENEWLEYFGIIYKSTISTVLREFQYKFLHRCIFTNDRLFKCKLSETNKCSFCKTQVETVNHLFWDCAVTQRFWNQVFQRCFFGMVHIIISISFQSERYFWEMPL